MRERKHCRLTSALSEKNKSAHQSDGMAGTDLARNIYICILLDLVSYCQRSGTDA